MIPSTSNLIVCLLGTSMPSIVKCNSNVTEYVQDNTMLVGFKYTIDCDMLLKCGQFVQANSMLVGNNFGIDSER